MRSLKFALWSVIATVCVVCAVFGANLALALLAASFAMFFNMPWVAEASILWLILVFWVLPKDWAARKKPYRSYGSALIDAPIADIWEEVRLRPRGESYRPVVSRIIADPNDTSLFYYEFKADLGEEAPTLAPRRMAVRVVEEEAERFLLTEYPKADDVPAWARDIISSEVHLEQREDGVEVTFVENLSRLSIAMMFSLFFINPCRDTAVRLKAVMEGGDDPSWMGRFMANVGPDGTPSAAVRNGVTIVGLSAITTATVIAVGLILFFKSAMG